MNKKIINATEVTECGIDFKSKLEVGVYKHLLSIGIVPEYEKHTYLLWEGFTPTVPFLTKNKFKRKDFRIEILGKATVKDNRPPIGITYTPDFEFDFCGKHIILETKGFANDLYGTKMKMFRKLLETLPNKDNIQFWEVHTKRQLIECLQYASK